MLHAHERGDGAPGGSRCRARSMAKSEHIRVVFLASGRTAWDEAGRIGGACDLPMTPGGREAVAAQAKTLADARLRTVLSAPDAASQETARIIAAACDHSDGPPKIRLIEDFRDVCLGLWEGLRHAEIEEKFPTVYRSWRDDPGAVMVPEAETVEEAQARIVQALRSSLVRATGEAAHAVVLRPTALALVRCWLDAAPLRTVWSMMSEAPTWRTIPRDQLRKRPAPVRVGA